MELLITEVTDMADGLCVAGWSQAERRMVRPVPPGLEWPVQLADAGPLRPGNVERFTPRKATLSADKPHSTEDTPVMLSAELVRGGRQREMAQSLAPGVTASARDAFGLWPIARRYIEPGTDCRSLGAIVIGRSQFVFAVGETGKLRAEFKVGRWETDLPVTSRLLHKAYAGGGIAAAGRAIGTGGRLYVRLGLSRPYLGRCYVMVNNVVALD